ERHVAWPYPRQLRQTARTRPAFSAQSSSLRSSWRDSCGRHGSRTPPLVLRRSLLRRMNEPAKEHLAFVRRIARRISLRSRKSGAVDFDDLVQAGTVGLLEGSARCDPEYGVSFAALAKQCVVGALM